jgi:hypothetical protein
VVNVGDNGDVAYVFFSHSAFFNPSFLCVSHLKIKNRALCHAVANLRVRPGIHGVGMFHAGQSP